jgi:hypothetical protein
MKVIASNGTDTQEVLKITYTDPETNITGPFDFAANGITRVDVIAGGITMSNGTNVSYAGDHLRIKFGKMGLQQGRYDVRVVIFSASSPDGVEIVGPQRSQQIVVFAS